MKSSRSCTINEKFQDVAKQGGRPSAKGWNDRTKVLERLAALSVGGGQSGLFTSAFQATSPDGLPPGLRLVRMLTDSLPEFTDDLGSETDANNDLYPPPTDPASLAFKTGCNCVVQQWNALTSDWVDTDDFRNAYNPYGMVYTANDYAVCFYDESLNNYTLLPQSAFYHAITTFDPNQNTGAPGAPTSGWWIAGTTGSGGTPQYPAQSSDDGAYEIGSSAAVWMPDTFAFTLVDADFPRIPGQQGTAVVVKAGGPHGVVHNLAIPGPIPLGELIWVYQAGGQWYTFYAAQPADDIAIVRLTGFDSPDGCGMLDGFLQVFSMGSGRWSGSGDGCLTFADGQEVNVIDVNAIAGSGSGS